MKEQGTEAQRDKGTKRRLFVFGSGIVVAVVIGAWVIAQDFILIPAKYKKLYDTPAIQDVDPYIFESSMSFRFVNFMLNDYKGMGLTSEQQSAIRDILRQCNEALKPFVDPMEKGKIKFDETLKDYKDKKISGREHSALNQEYLKLSMKYQHTQGSCFKQAHDTLNEVQKMLLWKELGKQQNPLERLKYKLRKKAAP